MPNHDPKAPPLEVADEETILGRAARNSKERHATLVWCLTNPWIGKDVGAIERWDADGWHGWLLWTWRS